MPNLDGSVGKDGNNKIHDVAVVQAALGSVKGRDRKPMWGGPIDGDYRRHRQSIDRVIAAFQQANRLRPTAKIARVGTDVGKLESSLPSSHRKMVGVPRTAAVRRITATAPPGIEAVVRATEKSAPLPRAEGKSLIAIQRKIAQAHKLCFTVDGVRVTPDGRFRMALTCPHTEWLDVRQNAFRRDARPPDSVRAPLQRAARAGGAWTPATSGAGDGLVFDTTRVFPALKGPLTLKREDLRGFGIERAPDDETARACLSGCIRLVTTGDIATGNGKREFDDLLFALNVIDPNAAGAVRNRAQQVQATPGMSLFQRTWVNPTGQPMRGSDPQGSGFFGASRKTRVHKGVDYISTVGQDVFAPTDSTFSATFKVTPTYGPDLPAIQLEIMPSLIVQIMYVKLGAGITRGTRVKAGAVIGQAVDIVPSYGPGMTNHVHVEIEDSRAGPRRHIDPSLLIP